MAGDLGSPATQCALLRKCLEESCKVASICTAAFPNAPALTRLSHLRMQSPIFHHLMRKTLSNRQLDIQLYASNLAGLYTPLHEKHVPGAYTW